MLKKLLSKIIALIISGFVMSALMHQDYLMWHQRGRDLYLASKVTFFDKHIATIQPWPITVIEFIIVAGICVVFYEITQLLIYKAFLFSSKPDQDTRS